MKSFIFEKTNKDGEVVRRVVDLESIIYVEETKVTEVNPENPEEKKDFHYVDVHLNVTHDMQFVKKQTNRGVAQEYTYALVPMTLKITGEETINRLFEALSNL